MKKIRTPLVRTLKLTSPAFKNGSYIPKKYTCDGLNISPPLEIRGVPKNTQSLLLIVDDPDAMGGIFDHWIVWNINPDTIFIGEDTKPFGSVIGLNSTEQNSYCGPCPPSGVHRYFFKLYAIDAMLENDKNLTKDEIISLIEDDILDHSELLGLYEKENKY